MRIIPTLILVLALNGGIALAANSGYPGDPACWSAPRVFHPGGVTAELADQLHIIEAPAGLAPDGSAITSPGGKHRYWLRPAPANNSGGDGSGVVIDNGGETWPVLLFENLRSIPQPRWLSDKLLFVRLQWGRMVFSDIIVDTETGALVYHEETRDGTIAWQQHRQACRGECICGEVQRPWPQSHPNSDASIGMLELPTVFGPGENGGVVAASKPEAVAVRTAPLNSASVLGQIEQPDDVVYGEIAYEAGAALVYERIGRWYRVQISNSGDFGWVDGDHWPYHPLPQLLASSLAYLNKHWRGELWQQPAPGKLGTVRQSSVFKQQHQANFDVSVLDTLVTASGVWLKVAVYGSAVCQGPMPEISEIGWVPLYSPQGYAVAAFFSRGC